MPTSRPLATKYWTGWAGDLLVASLRRRAIFRLQLEGERVVASEELYVGERIRDLEEDRDGRIWLMT